MAHPIKTAHLGPEQLEQAWPLVREIAGGVSLDQWRQFVLTTLAPVDPDAVHRGILFAERKRTIRGLVTYETVADLSRGPALVLRNAVVMDLALREPIALSLYESSVEVARETACQSLSIELTPQMTWIGEIWMREASAQGGLPVTPVHVQALQAGDSAENVVSVNVI